MKFKAYADLANMGAHLDVAAEQTSFITHDGLDSNSVTMSKTVHALLIRKCEGKALSLVSFVPRRFGLEAWRVLKEGYEGTSGNRTAALLRDILDPSARHEKMHSEGRDLGDMLASWEKDVALQNCRRRSPPAGCPRSDCDGTRAGSLPDLLKVVPLANREFCRALHARVDAGTENL